MQLVILTRYWYREVITLKQFEIGSADEGQRLNKYCGRILNAAPQSFIYKMLRKKNIVLNGKKADGSELLKSGDKVKFFLSDETFETFSSDEKNVPANSITEKSRIPSLLANEIVYEDDNILICCKPEGELSQKAKPEDISINERIVAYLHSSIDESEKGKGFVPGICNRLDRNTIGLICAGKNLKAQRFLSELFRNRTIDKYYLATVKGEFRGRLDSKLYITKDEKTNKSVVTEEKQETSSPIHSEFYGIVAENGYSIVKVKLKTGKSHQIRAQLSCLGYPIVGDVKYSTDKIGQSTNHRDRSAKTQMLLAYELVFPKCTDEFENLSGKVIKCRIPDKFTRFWEENHLWVHGKPEDLEVHF